MKLIHIPIEVKSREFVPKLFFISRALKKKYACFIGDKIAVGRSIKFFKGGIYFHKSINNNDEKFIINVKSKVDGYVALDEEAGNALNNQKELSNLLDHRSSIINVKNVDRIYNWGSFDNKVWKKKYPSYEKKFKITGLPRTDIWRKNILNSVFKNQIRDLKTKYKNFIFIPSTFISSKKKLIKVINFEKKRIKNKRYLKKKIEGRKFEHQLFLKFRELIIRLSEDLNNLNIVVKPHPSENINDWRLAVKNLKNVFIDDKYDITAYIQSAQAVIFNTSTAGIQSQIMNKKTICYKIIPDKKSLRNFPNNFGQECKSYTLLVKAIKEKKIKLTKKQFKLIKERLCIDKNFSSDLIINDFNELFKNLKKFKLNTFVFTVFSFLYYIKYIMKIDIFFNFFSKKKDPNSPLRSMKTKLGSGINKKEIESILKKLKVNNFNLLSFGKNGFLIYK